MQTVSIDILDKNFTYFSWGDKNADFMLNVRLSYPPISKTSVWKNPEFWSEDEMKNMILKVAWIIKNSEKLKSRFYRPILLANSFYINLCQICCLRLTPQEFEKVVTAVETVMLEIEAEEKANKKLAIEN